MVSVSKEGDKHSNSSKIIVHVDKGKFVPVLYNLALHHEGALGSGSIAPCILDLST
jgi:hypothetical protein